MNIPDFIPYQYCANAACSSFTSGLRVFRSHYNISGLPANNGTNGPSAFCNGGQVAPNCFESGGDMLGSQFLVLADQDYFALTGNEFLTWIE